MTEQAPGNSTNQAAPTSQAPISCSRGAEALVGQSTPISAPFDELTNAFSLQLVKCKETVEYKFAALQEENNTLRQQVEILDELQRKNAELVESLRQENQLLKRRLQDAKLKRSTSDFSDFASDETASPLNGESSAGSAGDVEKIRKSLELEKERSSRYCQALKKLKLSRKQDKQTIASWRFLLQRMRENASPGRNDSKILLNLILELETQLGPQNINDEPSMPINAQADAQDVQPSSSGSTEPCKPENQTFAEKMLGPPAHDQSVWTSRSVTAVNSSSSTNFLPATTHTPWGDNETTAAAGEFRIVPSSQSTQGESQALQHCNERDQGNAEDQQSSPVVLFTRNLKRKRTDVTEPATIKQEPHSSPFSTTGLASFFPTQQVDLDEMLPAVTTPRKQQRLTNGERSPTTEQDLALQDYGDHENQNELNQSQRLIEANENITGKGLRRDLALNVESTTFTADALTASPVAPILKNEFSEAHILKMEHSQEERALRPLNVNTSMLTPRSAQPKRLKTSSGDCPALPMALQCSSTLISDVENGEADSREAFRRFNPAGQRIQGLLETPTAPNKQLLTPRSGWTTLQKSTDPKEPKNSASSLKTRPQSNTKQQRRRGPTTEVWREDEPLRARPLERLALDDFKVNSKHNKGVSFAYNEVIRGRQRQCLPGCTQPECCGNQFQKMAEIGGFLPTPPSLWDSSEDVQNAEERLLRDYLGEQEAGRVQSMSEEERQRVLLEAKAKTLQSRWGKHRVAYPRSRTPPGFWRCDMPSTQEMEGDRELSEKLTREKVAERRREALKEEGMWKFRDE